jgi:hypothetical protein
LAATKGEKRDFLERLLKHDIDIGKQALHNTHKEYKDCPLTVAVLEAYLSRSCPV